MNMEWISLKDKRPTDWQDVLIALDTGAVVVGMRGPMGWHWADTGDEADESATATHWMLFPGAPVAGISVTPLEVGLGRLQRRLEDGASIAHQEDLWCLFDARGEGIVSGETLRAMVGGLMGLEG